MPSSSDYIVHKIPITIPFPVDPVNVYFLECAEPTLIDTGLMIPETFDVLTDALQKLGYSLEKIVHIILTHGHIDHFGMANKIKKLSGATLWAHQNEKYLLENFPLSYQEMASSYLDYSRKMGFPPDESNTVMNSYSVMYQIAEAIKIDKVLQEGDKIPVSGALLEVIHCPGHSEGSICLLDKKKGGLFAGDTILKEITPNPFFAYNRKIQIGLIYYLKTIEKLNHLNVKIVYPGHGEEISSLQAVIQKMRLHHTARIKQIMEILDGNCLSAFEISKRLFGNLSHFDTWLAFAETMSHLGLLENQQKVEPVERDKNIYFQIK